MNQVRREQDEDEQRTNKNLGVHAPLAAILLLQFDQELFNMKVMKGHEESRSPVAVRSLDLAAACSGRSSWPFMSFMVNS